MENKKFFVKDFIKYCSPCFACDKLMDLKFGFYEKGSEPPELDLVRAKTVSTVVTDKYVEVELSVRYRTNLKIWIFHRNNKVVTSDGVSFSNYLAERKLYLACICSCRSSIVSNDLDFQTFNGVVAPTTLRYETFDIIVRNRRYWLQSNFEEQKSVGTVRTYIAPNVSGPDLVFDMKLLPKYKLGDRQKLVDKLNTYSIFS